MKHFFDRITRVLSRAVYLAAMAVLVCAHGPALAVGCSPVEWVQIRAREDNCLMVQTVPRPMKIGGDATLWPLRAGQSLTMPGADTLTLRSMFGYRSPGFPLNVMFNNKMLADGTPRLVRSDDQSTWPPGSSKSNLPAVCIERGRSGDACGLAGRLISMAKQPLRIA